MSWVIYNAADYRWGSDEYPTKEAAESELREFYRGTSCDIRKFRIVEEDK